LQALPLLLIAHQLAQLFQIECPATPQFDGAGNFAARRLLLSVASLEAKNGDRRIDAASFRFMRAAGRSPWRI
jgi:hypothetical protein